MSPKAYVFEDDYVSAPVFSLEQISPRGSAFPSDPSHPSSLAFSPIFLKLLCPKLLFLTYLQGKVEESLYSVCLKNAVAV